MEEELIVLFSCAPFLIPSSGDFNEKIITSKQVLEQKARVQNHPQAGAFTTEHKE